MKGGVSWCCLRRGCGNILQKEVVKSCIALINQLFKGMQVDLRRQDVDMPHIGAEVRKFGVPES